MLCDLAPVIYTSQVFFTDLTWQPIVEVVAGETATLVAMPFQLSNRDRARATTKSTCNQITEMSTLAGLA